MKLRVRFGSGRRVAVVDVPGSEPTVRDAIVATNTALHKLGYEGSNIHLSLDGRTLLSEDETLRSVGIVAGDLVRVLTPVPIKVTCLREELRRPGSISNGEIPQSLRNFITSTTFGNVAEPLIALLNFWMLELGFRPRDSPDLENPKCFDRFPLREPLDPLPPPEGVSRWKRSSGLYVLKYRHVLRPESKTELLVSLMLPKLVVQGFTEALKDCGPFDAVIDTKLYSANDWKHVKCLEQTFKDRLGTPLLAANQSAAGVIPTGLLGLPNEIVEHVMHFCDSASRGRLASVCERFWHVDSKLRQGKPGSQPHNDKSRVVASLFL
ncbi:unnamed protein product [Notodromas monacha]|uniref:F-box domain-containing protein n=1 Tax=Notodromas monacha TaxID=399045 RepID=A0A7R9GAC5_9CRUS|nr:unnamed protein product [Notodromas monacha]CAG0915190.1 unnamed protein product [Notodromas monacha]